MPVILFKGLNLHTLPIDKNNNLRLVPGKNNISKEHLKLIQDDKKGSAGFKHLMDNDEIKILDENAVDTNASGDEVIVLANMTAGAIKTVIEAEGDIEILNAYLAEENTAKKPRAVVTKMIQAQIDSLNEAAEAAAKKAEENKD